jgi:hypothetical protein
MSIEKFAVGGSLAAMLRGSIFASPGPNADVDIVGSAAISDVSPWVVLPERI